MSMKKGILHYTTEFKAAIVEEQRSGKSVRSLSMEYGISRYAIQSWCGLRAEVNLRQNAPVRRGRPRKNPITTEHELQLENKRLKMENELLRDFLHLAGRK